MNGRSFKKCEGREKRGNRDGKICEKSLRMNECE